MLPAGQRIPTTPGLAQIRNAGPATPSPDHVVMQKYWKTARDLLLGLEAMIEGGTEYLPQHPKELPGDYIYRLNNAVLTNIYADIIETLAAKPFDDELQLIDGSASAIFVGEPVMVPDPNDPTKKKDSGARKGGLIENIDGKGNHLHVFAHDVFYNGINSAIDWIFVDFPKVQTGRALSKAEEVKQNIRPYWYRIPALNVLEVQSAMIGGKEAIVYARILEFADERAEDYQVVTKTRVREIERPKKVVDGIDVWDIPAWKLHELKESEPGKNTIKPEWVVIEEGTYSIGEIPMVPFICGKREGSSWVIRPPMKSAASLQVELYQQETGLKHISNLCYYPMLAANGVNLDDGKGGLVDVIIGPHTILNAPPSQDGHSVGSWAFVEPTAESGKFVAARIDTLKNELRELGRQPLTAQSGNITVITAQFASQKANSAISAWSILLKDAIENALLLTSKWLGVAEEPEVCLDLDLTFDLDGKGATILDAMRGRGDLSRDTYWSEMKRKGILSPEFDAEAEELKLAEEGPSEDDALAAAGGGNNNDNPDDIQP
jgi:hypothetical protein